MKVKDVKAYQIHRPTSGGKAGKGRNHTSTLQVRDGGQILKQFRYNVGNAQSYEAAMAKAVAWCLAQDPVKMTINAYNSEYT